MTIRPLVVALLVSPVILLQGCDQVKALLAFSGMGVGMALQTRPDRKLDYTIEVSVNDGTVLHFQGSTECNHKVGANGSGYLTKSPQGSVREQGVEWILSGIDCNNEIVEKKPGKYALYKKLDERQAKVHFVMANGAATLAKASFDSTFVTSSTESPAQFNAFSAGPYLYQKLFFEKETKPYSDAVSELSDPTVVFEGTNVCGKLNRAGLSLSKEDFFETFARRAGYMPAQHGVLDYRANADAWTPKPGADPSSPMDAATFVATKATDQKLEYGCVRILFRDRTFVMSENSIGSYLYIPEERAFYKVRRAWYSDVSTILAEKEAWKPCEMPPTPLKFTTGLVYRESTKHGIRASRLNPDGRFSCRCVTMSC